MEKQTKTLLGIGAVAVALYLILRPKGANAQIEYTTIGRPPILCNDGQYVQDNPSMPNARFADPCLNHGGIKEADYDPTEFGYNPSFNLNFGNNDTTPSTKIYEGYYSKEECEARFLDRLNKLSTNIIECEGCLKVSERDMYLKSKDYHISRCMQEQKYSVSCPEGKSPCPMNSNLCYDTNTLGSEGCTWVS